MKLRKLLSIGLSAALALGLLSGCSSASSSAASTTTAGTSSAGSTSSSSSSSGQTGAGASSSASAEASACLYVPADVTETEVTHAVDAETLRKDITGAFSITSDTGSGYVHTGGTYYITKEGTYTLSGLLDGNIVINAPDCSVELVLSDCAIRSSSAAPVFVEDADKVTITAAENTFNEFIDNRNPDTTDTSGDATAETAGAALYATCDLTLKGDGALVITASFNNGITTTKDLKIKNLTLRVTASGSGIKGKDSVTITSGEIYIEAKDGNGIKTSNSDISSKGNQRGTIEISGGNVDIYASGNGITASYDAVLSGDGNLNIYTASQTGQSSDFYLILSTSAYSEAYDYYIYYYNEGGDGVFKQAEYSINVSGGRSTYYGLCSSQPSGYSSMQIVRVAAGEDPATASNVLTSDGMSVNTTMNAYLISSFDSAISGDFVSLTISGLSSSKGIRADNRITIGDTIHITISSDDDALHAKAGEALENGETGIGSVEINGGILDLTSQDDAIHADQDLTINGGQIVIETSYEGLEAHCITLNDGVVYVYATDDGVNASTSYDSSSASVVINGGFLQVTTPSGDTDAIDSNGNYSQTGGYVIVRGGAATGSMAGGVDVDGTITVSGGCTLAVGGVCESPSGVNAYVSSSTSLSAGTYILADASGKGILSFTLDGSYSGFWVATADLETGTTYNLTTSGSSSAVISWTQESGTMGSSGGGMNPWGNMGGGGHGKW